MSVIIKATNSELGYETNIQTSSHQFWVDESLELSGKSLGPNPFEILASSLASCTCITLRMYANRKLINIGKIEVNVELDYSDPSQTVFKRSIQFTEPQDNELKQKLLNIANKCPIHKILSANIIIDSKLV